MDRSPPGSSVHGSLQGRILGWVAISSSRGSSQPRAQAHVSIVSCIGRQIHYHRCPLGSQSTSLNPWEPLTSPLCSKLRLSRTAWSWNRSVQPFQIDFFHLIICSCFLPKAFLSVLTDSLLSGWTMIYPFTYRRMSCFQSVGIINAFAGNSDMQLLWGQKFQLRGVAAFEGSAHLPQSGRSVLLSHRQGLRVQLCTPDSRWCLGCSMSSQLCRGASLWS